MHRNAPLTPEGRLRLCERIEGGWPVAHAAESMGISRDRAYVWWRRYQEEGVAGLEDRPCRPHRCPRQTKASVERRILTLRQSRGLGPARIAGIVGMHPSTVHRVLVRHGVSRLRDLDRTTREPIRRYEMSRPGELVHVDIQEAGPDPEGWGLASPRPQPGTPRRPSQRRLRLCPLRDRRLLPPRLFRSARQRAGSDRCWILATSPTVLRRQRHPGRPGPHGQWCLLPVE